MKWDTWRIIIKSFIHCVLVSLSFLLQTFFIHDGDMFEWKNCDMIVITNDFSIKILNLYIPTGWYLSWKGRDIDTWYRRNKKKSIKKSILSMLSRHIQVLCLFTYDGVSFSERMEISLNYSTDKLLFSQLFFSHILECLIPLFLCDIKTLEAFT